jgi:class 3 adenylate cyclase
MLATMSEFDPQAISETPLDWSDAGMDHEPLPTGTVTLLLADVQGSTQLWESQPEEMTAAIANLDRALAELVSNHHGVRPMEQGEGRAGFRRAGRRRRRRGLRRQRGGPTAAGRVAEPASCHHCQARGASRPGPR